MTNPCPHCKHDFEPERYDQVYCCPKCTKAANNIRYRAKHKGAPRKPRKIVRLDPETATHPCKRCGGPAKYRQVLCDGCKGGLAKPGNGIPPLITNRIRAARQREREAVERVVAQAIANGTAGSIDFWRDKSAHGIIRGTRIG